MNRLAITSILIAILLGTSFATVGIVNNKANKITEQINTIEEISLENNFSEAKEQSKKIAEEWKSAKNILCTYIPHDHLENIDYEVSALTSLCDEDHLPFFLSTCQRTKTALISLKENEYPLIQNIL